MIFETLNSWIATNKKIFEKNNLTFEMEKSYDNKKQTVVFSYRDRIASVELLFNGTVDFMIIDTDTENILFTETLERLNSSELIDKLNFFSNKFLRK